MEFKEISASNFLDGVVQEIDCDASFADISFGVGNGNYTYFNIKKEMGVYEDTLEEIDLERARYLLSADDMLEEMLSKA